MNIKVRAFFDTLSIVVFGALVAYLYTLAPYEILIIGSISLVLWFFYMAFQIRVTQLEGQERMKELKEKQ